MRNESVKTMTMCAIMAALMCILGPMSIPIGQFRSLYKPGNYTAVYLLGRRKRIGYLILIAWQCGWTSCIFWLYRRYCKAGRPDRRLSCRIYSACLNQWNCSGKDKQKHCLELCWYGSRNSNCLSVWNSLVCNPGTVYSRLCIKRMCSAIYPI